MPSYIAWALLGMAGYSFTSLFVKLATRAGLPSSVVIAIACTMVVATCWVIVIARGQLSTTFGSLTTPAGLWAIATGIALTIAVTAFFRALEAGPASIVVPVYGMFIVGGALLGMLFLGEALTITKAAGISLAVAGVVLLSL